MTTNMNNFSTLQTGAIALTFGSLNQLQNAAALIFMSLLKFYQTLFPFFQASNLASMHAKLEEAQAQLNQGLAQGISGVLQGTVLIGATVLGGLASTKAVNEGEADCQMPKEAEFNLEEKPNMEKMNTNTPVSDDKIAEEPALRVESSTQTEENINNTNTANDKEASQNMRDKNDKTMEAAQARQARANTIMMTYGNMGQAISQATGGIGASVGGYFAAEATREDAGAQVSANASQSIQAGIGQGTGAGQNQQAKEDAAAAAMVAMIQAAGAG